MRAIRQTTATARSSDEMRICRVPGSVEWERCRVRQAGATPFHRWNWLEMMGEALSLRFLPLGFYRGEELLGLTPLLVKQYGPYKNVNWAPFPYLGPLVPRDLLPEALTALDAYQRRNGIGLIQLGFAPDAACNARVLRAAGYEVRSDATPVLALEGYSEEELWRVLRSSGQRNVKRARRAGVVVRAATEHEMTSDLPSIMQEVFRRRSQPPPYSARAAELFWARYGDDANVRLATAHCDGETAAISVTLIDRDRAFMWDGGSRERYRRHSPDALLYWDSICWARERGCIAIDMVGSPEQGVADYKKSFGAIETPYLVANRVNSRLVALGRSAHNRATLLTYAVTQRLGAKGR